MCVGAAKPEGADARRPGGVAIVRPGLQAALDGKIQPGEVDIRVWRLEVQTGGGAAAGACAAPA